MMTGSVTFIRRVVAWNNLPKVSVASTDNGHLQVHTRNFKFIETKSSKTRDFAYIDISNTLQGDNVQIIIR